MAIKVTRNTGWFGTLSNIRVKVNGEKKEKIRNKQTVHIFLPTDPAIIQISQQGVKSKEITVRPGDEIEITPSILAKLFFPLLIIGPLSASFIPHIGLRTIFSGVILGLAVILFIFFFVPGAIFQLKKVSK